MTLQNKRLGLIILIAVLILSIPLLAMQFTSEVNWSFTDFIIAAILLLGAGFLIELAFRKAKSSNVRNTAIAVIVILLLLLWAELAVGLFGSPIAGS